MVHVISFFLPATFVFVGSARAANDWSKPCLSGTCSYDVVNGPASGSLTISGSPKAISDITTAAGWTILDCNATATAQDIRAVCTGSNSTCSHLYDGGAVGTLVRLPENCGKIPFARVAKEWTHENQTIPSQIKAKLRRRNDDAPSVRGISLDANFAAVDPSQNGQVSLYLQGSNASGDNGNFTITSPTQRSFFGDVEDDFGDAADDVKDAASDAAGDVEDAAGETTDDVGTFAGDVADEVENVAGDAADDVEDAAGDAEGDASDAVGDVEDAASNAANDVDDTAGDATDAATDAVDDAESATGDVEDAADDVVGDVEDAAGDAAHAVSSAVGDVVDGASNLVNDALNALSFNVSKSDTQTLDVDKPFTLLDQKISCPASGDLPAFTGAINVAVEAKAHADITYGVVATGSLVPPSISDFGLFANFDATLNGILTVNASATATFDTGKIQIFQVGIPGLDFPGILSIGPSFVVNVQGTATLDTELNMGVDLAYTVNNAKLFFPPGKGSSSGDFAPGNSDLSLAAVPSVAASGSLEAHIIPTVEFGINALDGLAQATVNLDLDSSAKLDLSLKAGASAGASTDSGSAVSGSFNGCVDVSTTLDANAGADGSFLDLFDKSTSVTLFQKTFDLFNKCFGSGSSKRRLIRQYRAHDALVRRALTCPAGGAATLSSIID